MCLHRRPVGQHAAAHGPPCSQAWRPPPPPPSAPRLRLTLQRQPRPLGEGRAPDAVARREGAHQSAWPACGRRRRGRALAAAAQPRPLQHAHHARACCNGEQGIGARHAVAKAACHPRASIAPPPFQPSSDNASQHDGASCQPTGHANPSHRRRARRDGLPRPPPAEGHRAAAARPPQGRPQSRGRRPRPGPPPVRAGRRCPRRAGLGAGPPSRAAAASPRGGPAPAGWVARIGGGSLSSRRAPRSAPSRAATRTLARPGRNRHGCTTAAAGLRRRSRRAACRGRRARTCRPVPRPLLRPSPHAQPRKARGPAAAPRTHCACLTSPPRRSSSASRASIAR
jgi:hypothetical protein